MKKANYEAYSYTILSSTLQNHAGKNTPKRAESPRSPHNKSLNQ
jgi:hypothetical protein